MLLDRPAAGRASRPSEYAFEAFRARLIAARRSAGVPSSVSAAAWPLQESLYEPTFVERLAQPRGSPDLDETERVLDRVRASSQHVEGLRDERIAGFEREIAKLASSGAKRAQAPPTRP